MVAHFILKYFGLSPLLSCTFSLRFAFLRFIKYLLFWARPVYFLECVFSTGWPCAVAQQCRLRHASVWLSGWGRSLGWVRGSECAGNTGCSPFAGQTGSVSLTHCGHSLSQHTQDRVRIVWRPVAMPGMLSPSSSLGKNGISFSVTIFSLFSLFFSACLWKRSAVWWEGSLGALADLFPLFCRFQTGQSDRASPSEQSKGELLPSTLVFPDPVPHPCGLITVLAEKKQKKTCT